MNFFWWWDAFLFAGAACAIALLMLFVWFLFLEIQDRRTFNREMKEFNEQMKTVSRMWSQNRD